MATRQYDFVSGVETPTQPSAGTPAVDDDVVTKGYADGHYLQGQAAIADIAALKAIAAADRNDRDHVFVDSKSRLYQFDAANAETGDDEFVVTPTAGTGRWLANERLPVKDVHTIKEQASAPSNPAAGFKKLYPKTDGKLYTKDSAGNEVEVGSGGGSGGINYIGNPDAETATTGWTASSAEIAITRSETDPIRGVASFIITTTASATTADYVEYQFSLANADVGSMLQWALEHVDSSNYTAGDLEVVFVKDPSGTPAIIESSALAIPSIASPSINNLARTWVTTAQDTYSMRIRVVTASTAFAIKMDTVSAGPEIAVQVPAMIDWTGYTPTYTGLGTVTTSNMQYKYNGDSLWIRGDFTTGTPTATEARISLPTGYNIDSGGAGKSYAGIYARDATNTSLSIFSLLTSNTLNYLTIGRDREGASTNWLTSEQGATISGSTERCTILSGPIAISELAGASVNVSVTKPDYASNSDVTDASTTTSGFQNGPAGQLGNYSFSTNRQKTVRYPTATQPTDKFELQISEDRVDWHPIPFMNSSAQTYGHLSSTEGVIIRKVAGTTTDVTVQWGRYRAGTTHWSASTFYWRVARYPGVIHSATVDGTEPSTMSDVTATKLGHKAYLHGTNYKDGNSPTITLSSGGGTLSSALGSTFTPYQMQDGGWMMKFNILTTLSGPTSRTTVVFAIAGVVFNNSSGVDYAVSASSSDTGVGMNRSHAIENTGTISLTHGNTTTTNYSISGDVPLDSKPTWAY